jgi:hypothetical protein
MPKKWQYHDRNRITWKYDAVLKQEKVRKLFSQKDHLATRIIKLFRDKKWIILMMKVEFIQDFMLESPNMSLRYFWTESTL